MNRGNNENSNFDLRVKGQGDQAPRCTFSGQFAHFHHTFTKIESNSKKSRPLFVELNDSLCQFAETDFCVQGRELLFFC